MVPHLVKKDCPYTATTLLDPLGRVKCTEGAAGPSRKTGEDSRGLGQTEGAEPRKNSAPLRSDGLAEIYNQVTRSAGLM
jgi:hypothetical protein